MVELNAPAHDVAPLLLGATLTSLVEEHEVVLRITEVEAYAGEGVDPGSHAFRGQTPRTAVMFGPAGFAYVYFTYGMHWCFNIVTGPVGEAGAVLVRAGQIIGGIDFARARRPSARNDSELARGPARLTMALGIDGSLNGVDLLDPESVLTLEAAAKTVTHVQVSARTGVGGAGARTPWRFFMPGEPSVSRYVAARPRDNR